VRLPILLSLTLAGPAIAQTFTGFIGGVSTLSADGRTVIDGGGIRVSLYKPENGPTFHVFAGRHFNDYLSAQASYGWNRNDVTLTSARPAGFLEQPRTAAQHSVAGELMLYFRGRESFARPYLTVGGGYSRITTEGRGIGRVGGISPPLPGEVAGSSPLLRVAVGIDLRITRALAFRYSFCESIQKNVFSEHLMPEGKRNLANFQNLFGFVWTFQRF
jgi:hypothetical protein